MSAGPLLKGQAARRGSEPGLGAAGTDGGPAAVLGGADRGSPRIQLDRVSGTQESAGTRRRRGSPREPVKLWGSVPSKRRQKHTVPRACPHPGTTLPISPGGGGGRAWGEGLPQGPLGSVVYWDCPLHAPHSQVGQGKEARRVRLSALRLTSLSLKLTGFSVVRSLNGRAASVFPLPTSRPPRQPVLCAWELYLALGK